jgi:NADH:ubiquinone oxidoreductase subunit 2 (subunit N)
VALGYYLRVIVAMYMEREPEGQAPPMTQRAHATFATGFCAAMVVLLGVLPGVFLDSLFG